MIKTITKKFIIFYSPGKFHIVKDNYQLKLLLKNYYTKATLYVIILFGWGEK